MLLLHTLTCFPHLQIIQYCFEPLMEMCLVLPEKEKLDTNNMVKNPKTGKGIHHHRLCTIFGSDACETNMTEPNKSPEI